MPVIILPFLPLNQLKERCQYLVIMLMALAACTLSSIERRRRECKSVCVCMGAAALQLVCLSAPSMFSALCVSGLMGQDMSAEKETDTGLAQRHGPTPTPECWTDPASDDHEMTEWVKIDSATRICMPMVTGFSRFKLCLLSTWGGKQTGYERANHDFYKTSQRNSLSCEILLTRKQFQLSWTRSLNNKSKSHWSLAESWTKASFRTDHKVSAWTESAFSIHSSLCYTAISVLQSCQAWHTLCEDVKEISCWERKVCKCAGTHQLILICIDPEVGLVWTCQQRNTSVWRQDTVHAWILFVEPIPIAF